jgi:hypothetical protein
MRRSLEAGMPDSGSFKNPAAIEVALGNDVGHTLVNATIIEEIAFPSRMPGFPF